MFRNYNESEFEPGKIVAAIKKGYRPVFNDIEVEKIEEIFHPQYSTHASGIEVIVLIYLKDKRKQAVVDAIEQLEKNPCVVYAEPDCYADMFAMPNDLYYRYLWGMAQINAPSAWNYTTGSANIIVGVVDSGIDYVHPDIQANMQTTPDGQRIYAWDFSGRGNPVDTNGHGTHAAGTIGAVGNNRIGVAGVCWTVKLASLKVGGYHFDLAPAITAIDYANMYNIPILNNSWGGSTYSASLKFAIEHYNGLFIAAAGNAASNNDLHPIYPASYGSDNIISVAATDQNGELAQFSNYGAVSVDIAAPGERIFSTSLRGEYSYMSGTSMSAPHVAGAAALIKAYRPELTMLEIKRIILSSVERRLELAGKVSTGGVLDVGRMMEWR